MAPRSHGRMSDVDQASSKYWQRSTKASGIFSRSANNSAFAAANLVYVRYCSSDAWMGNTFMWEEEFRGAPTVYAVFDDLFANMGLASGAQLLFGGCSAGARGAMVHLDNVVAMLAQQGVQARGLLDSGLWLDVEPVTNTGMGGTLLKQTEYVYGFANVSSVIPADCAAAYAGEEYKWCVSRCQDWQAALALTGAPALQPVRAVPHAIRAERLLPEHEPVR